MPLILPKAGIFEFEEKKSKFIGHCILVQQEEEAKEFIKEVSSIHSNANHNVYAYSIPRSNIIRFNDNGEPGGTAGMPVLNVFQKAGVIDFVCVVTRYFGGTLLGAGGLVRAYTKTAKGAMEAAEPEEQVFYKTYLVTCTYSNLDKVKYNLEKADIEVPDWVYTEQCQAIVRMREEQNNSFLTSAFEYGISNVEDYEFM
ncbi:MAG: YigZ family protein [Defluviitaleaceae bacterium]|nr:YigZ family protein [Defluviitaleaceae bacterium]